MSCKPAIIYWRLFIPRWGFKLLLHSYLFRGVLTFFLTFPDFESIFYLLTHTKPINITMKGKMRLVLLVRWAKLCTLHDSAFFLCLKTIIALSFLQSNKLFFKNYVSSYFYTCWNKSINFENRKLGTEKQYLDRGEPPKNWSWCIKTELWWFVKTDHWRHSRCKKTCITL